jgi:ubiquinone/menaquinone biosynthesis C-methylase UbiE
VTGIGSESAGVAESVARRLDTADANRRFYSERARVYDLVEHCVVDHNCRVELREVLSDAISILKKHPRALDACGGAGNAAEVLAELGATPVVVDISPEMLAKWRTKARSRGLSGETVAAEIVEFFERDSREWDLIIFSSALHHLENYDEAIRAAVRRLVAGGVVVTIFDPTLQGRVARAVRRLDWIAYAALREPHQLSAGMRRRLLNLATHGGASLGARAERHASTGVDDLQLRRTLEQQGLEVLSHTRYVSTRLWWTAALLRLMRAPNAFRLTARKAALNTTLGDWT